MVLHAKIISELFKVGIRYGKRYYALESKAFNKLYTGFPQSRTIGRGVRHGLTGGSVIGSVLNENGEVPVSGLPKKSRNGSKARPSYKTRNRFTGRNRFRSRNKCYPYLGKGRSRFS